MISQPDFGKQVAELRKAKGLTQEELVDQCNLSVRTLQRIEAGEVEPRIYTVKLILKALDVQLNGSHNSYDFKQQNKRPGQLYAYILDLFNLKTKTMKKITILSTMLASIVAGVFFINTETKAQKNDEQLLAENDKPKKEKVREIVFTNFTCYGCFEEEDVMVGRDVSFTLTGVKVKNIRLIYLNKKTREFNALFVEGTFKEGSVDLTIPKDMLYDLSISYKADKIEKTDSQIILKGNAIVMDQNKKETTDDDESIEAEKIILNLI